MLLMPLKALKSGMVLAQPIFHPRLDRIVLLEKGFVLTNHFIARLRELAIPCVWVEFSGLEEIQSKINGKIAAQHYALYQALQSSITDLQDRVAVEMNIVHYKTAIEQILVNIVEDPHHEILIHQLAGCTQQIAGHLSNCCYLSLLIGAHMSGYLRQQRRALPAHIAEETNRLGLGALLHDIGKLGMPPELQHVCILDDEATTEEYRAHTQAGYERIKGNLPGAAGAVVLHHHQRYCGKGFPEVFDKSTHTFRPPPAYEQIHVFARIVGAVDVFDHLLWQGGRSTPTIIALYQLRNDFPGWFDPNVIDTITRLVPPFMVGTVVELSDGKHAVVVDNHLEAPCRPTIRVLTGSVYQRGSRVEGPPIDLRLHREPHIARVDGVDVRAFLFGPGTPRRSLEAVNAMP